MMLSTLAHGRCSPTALLCLIVLLSGSQIGAAGPVAPVGPETPLETAIEIGYELPPTLSASDLVPTGLLTGPHYQVESRVTTDGFLCHYRIQSDFGDFSAIGPGSLQTLLREIAALATLQEIEQSEELQSGAKNAAARTAAGVRHFIEEPEETLKGVPEGVGRFFKRTYRSAKTGVQMLQDVHEGRAPGAPPETGPGSRLPGGPSASDGSNAVQGNIYGAAARATGDVAVNALGYDDNRRRLARRLGVDPYTTNRTLAEKLDEVSWAAFAGNLGVDLLTAMVPGGNLVRTSTQVSDWVWDTPPGDLRVAIERSLLDMGVDRESIDLLLRHRWYPLSLQAALVEALNRLDGVAARPDVMPLALTVASVDQARYLVDSLRMTARYHETVKPLRTLAVFGTLVAQAEDDELVVAAPADFVSWTETLDRFASQPEIATPVRSLHLAGYLTERARTELEARGWAVYPDSTLFTTIVDAAPAYDSRTIDDPRNGG